MKRMMAKANETVPVVLKAVEYETENKETVPEVHVHVNLQVSVQICLLKWCWNVAQQAWHKLVTALQ